MTPNPKNAVDDAQTVAAPAERPVEEKRRCFACALAWARTPWGLSIVVHLVLVVCLGVWTITRVSDTEANDLVGTVIEPPDEWINQVLEVEVTPSKLDCVLTPWISKVIGVDGTVQNPAKPKRGSQVKHTSPAQPPIDVALANVFSTDPTVLVQELPEGGTIEGEIPLSPFAEFLSAEIAAKLAKGKVLVIWCFDESHSAHDDRLQVMCDVERMYKKLGSQNLADESLLTAITSYSMTTHFHTPMPTSNVEEIVKAMGEVQVDESGVENMCQAVGESIAVHRKYATTAGRQMMLVLVSDESGDPESNVKFLEPAIAEARQAHCPIYVIGREAVFGYPYAHFRWEDPPTGIPTSIQLDRGPETPFPELLQIDGLERRRDANASGFGPYDQTRMARLTGGRFFMLTNPEANLIGRDSRKYALEAMRPYLPDLSSCEEYTGELYKHEFRRVISKVISDLNPYSAAGRRVEVRVDNFSIDRDEFRRQAAEEITQATALIGYLKAAEKELEIVKPLRGREASARWRANFDLMHAQTIAYQVRLHEYAAYLQVFMNSPKPIKNYFGPKRPTNAWKIRVSSRTIMGDQFKRDKDRATRLFIEIMREHVGTPYASRAEWEINRGFGVELFEDYVDARRDQVKWPKL